MNDKATKTFGIMVTREELEELRKRGIRFEKEMKKKEFLKDFEDNLFQEEFINLLLKLEETLDKTDLNKFIVFPF